jgi:TonB family protein
MFNELPETNPIKSERKPRAIAAAGLIQVVFVSAIILVQMAVPQRFGEFQLISTSSMAAPPPLSGQAIPKRANESARAVPKVNPQPDVAQPERSEPAETLPAGVANGQVDGAQGGIQGGEPGGAGEAIRVGGNIREPQIIKLVKPKYPPEAIQAHVDGAVILEATINEKGDVVNVKVVSGPPTLISAAIEAVQQWKSNQLS